MKLKKTNPNPALNQTRRSSALFAFVIVHRFLHVRPRHPAGWLALR
jgi:hypothetical protein